MENKQYDLTQGGILNKLLTVALPIMGTQFMQMTYNLTDMFWLGRLGSNSVAASGTVGMYLWLSMAFMIFGRMGAEIGVSQNLGRGDDAAARTYAQTSIFIGAVLGAAYTIIMIVFHTPLIGFFAIQEASVVAEAELYLVLVSLGIVPSFITAVITGCFNGSGNSKMTFLLNTVGLALNLVLDPLFIFGFGLGISGAAIATVIGQTAVCVCLAIAIKRARHRPFASFSFFVKPVPEIIKQVFKWSAPVALESLLFTLLSMFISRIIAAYGASAIAVQRVGSQIESLSWLISGGYSSALTAFVGQNYGAGKWTRIHRGFRISMGAMFVWGIAVTAILYLGAAPLFSIFLPQPEIVEMGVVYLRILAVCQIAGCIEFTTAGCFRGMGRTLPPSAVSIICNAARVFVAYALARRMGLSGVWWGISIGALARGIWMFAWYYVTECKLPKDDVLPDALPATEL